MEVAVSGWKWILALMVGKNVLRKATNMMSKNSLPETSSTTKRMSPMIIEDASAMLPEEIWMMIFEYMDYRDLSNLQIVSDNFNAIATRSLNIKYKFYELCRKNVPERHWCEILERARHPINDRINCRDFHAEKEYPEIWEFLYSTWTKWLTITDKQPEVQRFDCLPSANVDIPNWIIGSGKILARYAYGIMCFFDILRITDGPITAHRFCDISTITLSRKGDDVAVTAIEDSAYNGAKTIKTWDVQSQKLIQSTDCEIEVGSPIFTCESFGYTCLVSENSVQIVEASTGSWRTTRFCSGYCHVVRTVEAHGDTLMILSKSVGVGRCDIRLHNMSIRECRFKGISETSLPGTYIDGPVFFICKPCTVACYDVGMISFSVSGRKWKTYYRKTDLKLEAGIVSAAYEYGVLVLTMKTGNIHMIYVDDPEHLDLNLETMPSRMVMLNWKNIDPFIRRGGMRTVFMEYDSKIHLIVAEKKELKILTF